MAAISNALRDSDVLRHIARYCSDAIEAAAQVENETAFSENRLYQHAVAMCILEIGELSKHISEDFAQAHPEIPWRAIRRMRDLYAHHYHRTDPHQLWITATQDLPPLKAFCDRFISDLR